MPVGPDIGTVERIAADIPGFDLSSCSCVVVGPGDGFLVAGVVFEAAVEDAEETVGELAQRGLVADVSSAQRCVVGAGAG